MPFDEIIAKLTAKLCCNNSVSTLCQKDQRSMMSSNIMVDADCVGRPMQFSDVLTAKSRKLCMETKQSDESYQFISASASSCAGVPWQSKLDL